MSDCRTRWVACGYYKDAEPSYIDHLASSGSGMTPGPLPVSIPKNLLFPVVQKLKVRAAWLTNWTNIGNCSYSSQRFILLSIGKVGNQRVEGTFVAQDSSLRGAISDCLNPAHWIFKKFHILPSRVTRFQNEQLTWRQRFPSPVRGTHLLEARVSDSYHQVLPVHWEDSFVHALNTSSPDRVSCRFVCSDVAASADLKKTSCKEKIAT